MAWPSSSSGDFLSGADAETRGQDLYDRVICAKQSGSTAYFAEASETGTSYVTKASFDYRVPVYARSGDLIQVTIVGYYSGAASGEYRAIETGVPTNGSEQTLNSGVYAASTSEITIPDNTWAATVKTIAMQAKVTTSGTAYIAGAWIMGSIRVKTS